MQTSYVHKNTGTVQLAFVSLALLLATSGQSWGDVDAISTKSTPENVRYYKGSSGPKMSYGSHGDFVQEEKLFEVTLTDFYATLLQQQKPLDDVFSQVLQNNLWDLYSE